MTIQLRTYTGDNSTADFAVPFRLSEACARQGDMWMPPSRLTAPITTGLLTSRSSSRLGKIPALALKFLIRRETPESDQIVLWQNGSYVVAEDLNESDLQWLYLIQEHHDQIHDLDGGILVLHVTDHDSAGNSRP